MKFNNRYMWVLILALAIMTIAGAFAGIPTLKEYFSAPVSEKEKEEKEANISTIDKEQESILKEMLQVLHGLDSTRAVSFSGNVTVNDQADSSNSIAADFVYTRNGDQGYYKIGDNETLSVKDAYLSVVHSAKKIFISQPAKMMNPIKPPVAEEIALLSNDGYNVTRKKVDSLTEISLVNNKHVSCREYRITFDRAGAIHHIHMRLPDMNALSDLSKDKLIDVNISDWQSVARPELLDLNRYVAVKNGDVKQLGRFQDYEVIKDF